MKKHSYSTTVLPIIRCAREMLLPHYGAVAAEEKSSHKRFDLVTKLDTRVENFLRKELQTAYPDISFVGEEAGGNRDRNRFWLVDPIDGTEHFVRGLPFCTTMLALVETGAVVFSVIYDFVNDTIFSAELGRGAFRNGEHIRVSARSLRESRICWSMKLSEGKNMERFARLCKSAYVFHVGPTGYESAMIASGKLDALVYASPSYNDYDVAPGMLLIKEAGGVVANIGKKTYDYRNLDFIAANPTIFRELTEGPDAIFPIQ